MKVEGVCVDCINNVEKCINGKFIPWCWVGDTPIVERDKCLYLDKWAKLEEIHLFGGSMEDALNG